MAPNSPDADRRGDAWGAQRARPKHKRTVVLKENCDWPSDFKPTHAVELDFAPFK